LHRRLLALAAALCATAPAVEPLRVNVEPHPDLDSRAAAIRDLCSKWYPRIDELLYGSDHQPAYRNLNITYMMQRVAGSADRNSIRIDPVWAAKADQGEFEGVLIHELTHVVEDYRGLQSLRCDGLRGVYCFFRVRLDFSGNRYHWISEGIADYIRFAHFQPERRAQFNPPDLPAKGYKRGYQVAAAFLLWLEQNKDKDIVRSVNRAVNAHTYSPAIFRKRCGASLDQLWAEFVRREPVTSRTGM
jgi:hypothetical protein